MNTRRSYNAGQDNPNYGKHLSPEHKKKISDALTGRVGRKHTEGTREKIRLARTGKKLSSETVEKIRKTNKLRWVGHTNSPKRRFNNPVRQTAEYKKWRRLVLERDGNKCVLCGAKEVPLQADHKKSLRLHPELVFDIDNGRALCAPCHRKTDTYGWRGRWVTKTLCKA